MIMPLLAPMLFGAALTTSTTLPLTQNSHHWQGAYERVQTLSAPRSLSEQSPHHAGPGAGLSYQLLKSVRKGDATIEKYQLSYQGVPVLGSEVVFVVTDDKQVTRAIGNEFHDVSQLGDISQAFAYSQQQVLNHIRENLGYSTVKVYSFERGIERVGEHYQTVYAVDLLQGDGTRPQLLLDSRTLNTVRVADGIAHFSAPEEHAVAAMTGNYKLGLNCLQAPNMATTQCQNIKLPLDHPRTKLFFPEPPVISNVYYTNSQASLFSQFDGYPMVIEWQDGRCHLRNSAVETLKPASNTAVDQQQAYSYDCPDGPQESYGVTSEPYYYYMLKGSFQPVNDAHFYGGLTAQMLTDYFQSLYPNQQQPCPTSDPQYCLKPIRQRVDYHTEKYQSNWDGTFTNLGRGGQGPMGWNFPHGSSLDVVAHEIGHALLEWNTGIVSSNVAQGALHESFADITAMAVKDYYLRHLDQGTGSNNWANSAVYGQLSDSQGKFWHQAWDLFFADRGMRYLNNPRWDGVSIDDYRDRAQSGVNHHRAGVLNKFFYLLASSPGWSVERAYRLVLEAMTQCFPSHAGMLEASECILAVTEDPQQLDMLSTLMQQVGLVPQSSSVNNLAFEFERAYQRVAYRITDTRFTPEQVVSLEITLDGEPLLSWSPSSEQSWHSVAAGHFTLAAKEQLLKWQVTLSNGEVIDGYRIASLIDGAQCIRQSAQGSYVSTLNVNGEQLDVTAGYASVRAVDSLFSNQNLQIQFDGAPETQQVQVFFDKDRNGGFDTNNERLDSVAILDSTLTLPHTRFSDMSEGLLLVRVVLTPEQINTSCPTEQQAQVIDVYVNFEHGDFQAPDIAFSYQQYNSDFTLQIAGEFSQAYSFRWLIGDDQIDSTSYTLERQIEADTEITLLLLRSGIEVNRTVQTISPVVIADQAVTCQQNGLTCVLQLRHSAPPGPVTYQWQLDGQLIQRSDNTPFEFSFDKPGEHPVTVVMQMQNGQVQISHQQVLTLQAVPELEVAISQYNNTLVLSVQSGDVSDLIYIWELNGETMSGAQASAALTQLGQSYPVLLKVMRGEQVIAQVEQEIYVYQDIELDFSWQQVDDALPLTFSFTASHKAPL
ncbi:M4 family metallopeptidase [Pseudoalteromonas viridis]|uniref:M4 family metallopeptidase n=1 Tax=Pseudoalteromonas viridis TaxID=339617 RepID=A0ABX7V7S5_9GAMM|nr:M4 family metallopeptidase [Pseudoalteromonas viridis]QTL35497.1 M4 family metallopeptidase [Pseudoalteromonas viridis]